MDDKYKKQAKEIVNKIKSYEQFNIGNTDTIEAAAQRKGINDVETFIAEKLEERDKENKNQTNNKSSLTKEELDKKLEELCKKNI